jgi:hypothetical protein
LPVNCEVKGRANTSKRSVCWQFLAPHRRPAATLSLMLHRGAPAVHQRAWATGARHTTAARAARRAAVRSFAPLASPPFILIARLSRNRPRHWPLSLHVGPASPSSATMQTLRRGCRPGAASQRPGVAPKALGPCAHAYGAASRRTGSSRGIGLATRVLAESPAASAGPAGVGLECDWPFESGALDAAAALRICGAPARSADSFPISALKNDVYLPHGLQVTEPWRRRRPGLRRPPARTRSSRRSSLPLRAAPTSCRCSSASCLTS